MSASGKASLRLAANLLANTTEDIDKKGHKRDPFGLQYMQLLQTPLNEASLQPDDANEALDSATASIHVRIELLKTMKQALLKHTADEVKQSKQVWTGTTKAAAKAKQKPHKQEVELENGKTGNESFFSEPALQLFQDILEGRDIDIQYDEFCLQLATNAHTKREEEIAFDVSALALKTFQQLTERLFPATSRHDNESLQCHNALIKDDGLLQMVESCVKELTVHDKIAAPPVAGTAGRVAQVTQLPSYLQRLTLSGAQIRSLADTAEGDGVPTWTDYMEAPHAHRYAELPLHLQDNNAVDAIVFAAKGSSSPGGDGVDECMETEHHCCPVVMSAPIEREAGTMHSDREGQRKRAPVLTQRRLSAAVLGVMAPTELPRMDEEGDDGPGVVVDADDQGYLGSAVSGALGDASYMHTIKPLAKPRLRKRPALQLSRACNQQHEPGVSAEDNIENLLDSATEEGQDDKTALASITIEPDYTLAHLASLHAETFSRHPSRKKAAYKPVLNHEVLLVPNPPQGTDLQPDSCLAPEQLMQVFISSLEKPHQPWASLEESFAREKHSAQARKQPAPICRLASEGSQHDTSRNQPFAASRHAAGNAELPVGFGLDRPATAKELMSELQTRDQAQHDLQREMSSLSTVRAATACSRQPAACLPKQPPSALGVFADYSDSEDDDTDLLQAAMDAEQQLQHGRLDRAQDDFPVTMNIETNYGSQSGGAVMEQEMAEHAPFYEELGPQAHLTKQNLHARPGHIHSDIPGIVYECSNQDAHCHTSEQLRDTREPENPQGYPSMQAGSSPIQAGASHLNEAGLMSLDALLAEGELLPQEDVPAEDANDFVFCYAQDTAWQDQPTSLQGQEGQLTLESPLHPLVTHASQSFTQSASLRDPIGEESRRMSAQQARWHSNAQRSTQHFHISSAAKGSAQHAAQPPRTLNNPSSAVRARGPDRELEDICMTDGSGDVNMQSHPFRQEAATACDAENVLAVRDSQGLHVPARGAVKPALEHVSDCASQSERGLDDQDSEGIVFDDTAVNCTLRWMQGDIESQAAESVDDMGLEPQHMPSNPADARARQKRAREELRDKLIQELLEDSGRSSKLEPLIAHMRDKLAVMTPSTSGLYPTSLLKLRQSSMDAHLPGSEASQKRHMFALLTLVQRCNAGTAGAGNLSMPGKRQLKLETVHGSRDLHIYSIPCG